MTARLGYRTPTIEALQQLRTLVVIQLQPAIRATHEAFASSGIDIAPLLFIFRQHGLLVIRQRRPFLCHRYIDQ